MKRALENHEKLSFTALHFELFHDCTESLWARRAGAVKIFISSNAELKAKWNINAANKLIHIFCISMGMAEHGGKWEDSASSEVVHVNAIVMRFLLQNWIEFHKFYFSCALLSLHQWMKIKSINIYAADISIKHFQCNLNNKFSAISLCFPHSLLAAEVVQ